MTEAGDDHDAEVERAGIAERDGLAVRLAAIEERPLSDRAGAYVELHESLSTALESGDSRHPE